MATNAHNNSVLRTRKGNVDRSKSFLQKYEDNKTAIKRSSSRRDNDTPATKRSGTSPSRRRLESSVSYTGPHQRHANGHLKKEKRVPDDPESHPRSRPSSFCPMNDEEQENANRTPLRGYLASTSFRSERPSRHQWRSCDTGSDTASVGHWRPYHTTCDPNITLRQVKERLEMTDMRDWSNITDLEDQEEHDLARYKLKLERRAEAQGGKGAPVKFPLEENLETLSKRQRTLDKAKISESYQRYLFQCPKPKRQPYMPMTPNKFRVMPRRQWDNLVARWKKHLHHWDDPEYASKQLDATSLWSNDSSRVSVCSSDSADVKNAIDNSVKIVSVKEEDSNTMVPLASSPFETKGTTAPHFVLQDDDDDAANLDFGTAKVALRTRTQVRNSTTSAVEPDVLHSGLTNEVNRKLAPQQWTKRSYGRAMERDHESTAANGSPKKKLRRN